MFDEKKKNAQLVIAGIQLPRDSGKVLMAQSIMAFQTQQARGKSMQHYVPKACNEFNKRNVNFPTLFAIVDMLSNVWSQCLLLRLMHDARCEK